MNTGGQNTNETAKNDEAPVQTLEENQIVENQSVTLKSEDSDDDDESEAVLPLWWLEMSDEDTQN